MGNNLVKIYYFVMCDLDQSFYYSGFLKQGRLRTLSF